MQPGAIITLFTIFLATAPLSAPLATTLQLETGASQNTLVELYTSEGCSSCPPAESFLNDFKNNSALWSKIIPLAFHVNYWDYIGWKDRFAQPAFGKRQSKYAQLQRRSTVYTPAFFVNGSSWRPGIFSNRLPEFSQHKTGKLNITLNKDMLTAHFYPAEKTRQTGFTLNIALLGNALTTRIKAGENQGRNAKHEFVVLNHQQHHSNDPSWQVRWSPLNKAIKSLAVPGYAIAIWVNHDDHLAPLQATGAKLPDKFFKQ